MNSPSLISDLLTLSLAAAALTSLSGSVTEKGVNCRRLKDQLDTLERETTDKLAQMEQYNKELQVSGQGGADSGHGGGDICRQSQRSLDHLDSTRRASQVRTLRISSDIRHLK